MPVWGTHANCLICGWAHEGQDALDRFEKHMDDEHTPQLPRRGFSEYDKKLLRLMRIAPEWDL